MIVSSAFAPSLGGVEELVRCLALELAGRGAAPVVATNRWPRELPARSVIDGTEVLRINFRFPSRQAKRVATFIAGLPSALFTLVREIRRRQAEVVHVQCVSSNALYALLAARLARVPLVVTLQGELTMDADRVYETDPVLRWLLRHLLERADHVTACSAATLADAHRFLGRPGAPSTVIYNGVRLEEFAASAAYEAPRPYVFALGRHVREKGFDVLLGAFARSGLGVELDLVIAGDGPERSALESLAASLGLGETVRFVGRTERATTASLFHSCQFFVLPSRHEPFGIVNVEAMAAGRAVIATRSGGVPEIVEDGITGLLVEPGDEEELAAAMTRLTEDPELAKKMGDAGRNGVGRFSWRLIADQYVDVYRAVLTAGASRRGLRVRRGRAHSGSIR